jgi:hypothetical protein
MSTATESDSNPLQSGIYRVLKAIRGSILLSFVSVGLFLLGVGMIFEIANVTAVEITQQDGIIAGMLGVFGISAVAAAGIGYGILQIMHRK